MTEKELRKLHRRDLLELLLEQGKEAVQLGNQLAETQDSLDEVQAGNDRLKTKLDDKDEQIEKLKARLNEKDAQIGKLKSRLDEKDAKIHNLRADVQTLSEQRKLEIGEIITALKLDGFLELIQQASSQYLLNVKRAQETIVEGMIPPSIEPPDDENVQTEAEPEGAVEISENPDISTEFPETAKEEPLEEPPEEQSPQEPYTEETQSEDAPSEEPPKEDSEESAEDIEPRETEQEEPDPETAEKNTINIEAKHFWQRWRKSRQ